MPRPIPVEVGVKSEMTSRQRQRWAGAPEVRVRDQSFDPGERGNEVEKRHAAELGEQMTNGRVNAVEARAL